MEILIFTNKCEKLVCFSTLYQAALVFAFHRSAWEGYVVQLHTARATKHLLPFLWCAGCWGWIVQWLDILNSTNRISTILGYLNGEFIDFSDWSLAISPVDRIEDASFGVWLSEENMM